MRLSREGLLTAVLVVAALFVGSFVAQRLPQPDGLSERPFLRAGSVGEPVTLRTAEVMVTHVQAAKRVALFGQVSESAGVWLVVDVAWSPLGEPSALLGTAPVVVAADGRVFGGAQAVMNNCGPTQPGLPVTCQLPFEVAGDALEGAHLRVPAGVSVQGSDDVADIDLGIDASAAGRMADTDAQVSLRETTGVGR